MLENHEHNASRDDHRTLSVEYLKRAHAAEDGGDALLSMHLYLAAFEEAAAGAAEPSEDALDGLKQAWTVACASKERSLAEYIFEKMEPYLTADEITVCADQLQSLALDKLEEFGLSREELEGMAEMISQDLLGEGATLQIDGIVEASSGAGGAFGGMPTFAVSAHATRASDQAPAPVEESESSEAPAEAAQVEPEGEGDGAPQLPEATFGNPSESFDYRTIAGYQETIKVMHDFGIGLADDEDFKELVGLLNARHGLSRMPAIDSLLFRSPAREDANRFIAATAGEIGLPVVRMHMEENLQGMPVLCVSAQASDVPKPGSMRNVFDNGGVLVLEDLDLWTAPTAEPPEEMSGFLMMQLSRGAHEAISMVRSAVENPEVYVLASASAGADIMPFFLELLEPLSVIDIDLPTPEERVELWMDLARAHPSLRSLNRADLVRFSANMPRFDIYMAVREAIEEAYKLGLVQRRYQPITRENLFDKLAAYQPLESAEYRELEDEVLKDFRSDLGHIEDLLQDEE